MNQSNPTKRVVDMINGVLLLNKPVGISSNTALMKAKRLLNAKKAGHTGTLDPFASGLLPLCFGEATKFAHDLLDADKSYETVVHLGVTTTTGDTEGDVVNTLPVHVTHDQLLLVLNQFRGEISQIPPMYSALKRDGKPLYEYARQGINIERAARQVVIRELILVNYEASFLKLKVTCSKGTYIRVLGEDIGRALGCGGHLQALCRTQVGNFVLDDAVSLPELEQQTPDERRAQLRPVDTLLSRLPLVQLSDELATRLMHGQRLSLTQCNEFSVNNPSMVGGRVKVYRNSDSRLLGVAFIDANQILAPERLLTQ